MPVTVVLGTQWGDEGKGKIVDLLAKDADLVIRFNGGNNAGHTIQNEHTINMEDGVAKLHLIPAGIFNPKTTCIIGTGTAVHLGTLIEELNILQKANIDTSNLLISRKAHLIMPWHIVLDEAEEAFRNKDNNKQIGTTKRGIGPAYASKHARSNLRVEDLLLPWRELHEKFFEEYDFHRQVLNKVLKYEPELLGDGNYFSFLQEEIKQITEYIADTESVAWKAIASNKNILLEGAQATLLDIDHGTYPFVTSSACSVAAASQGSGIPASLITERIGIVKAYSTRVGAGAFPTKMDPATDELIRKFGNEFGATTGRPRACGWLDLPLLKYSHNLNRFTSFVITKLDVLTRMPNIKIGVGYVCYENKMQCDHYNCGFMDADVVYSEIKNWKVCDISEIETREALPSEVDNYIGYIEDKLRIPAKLISVGPDREQTIKCF